VAACLPCGWREANKEAIAAYNEFVNEHGTFADGVQV
jgi:post-segregation antitoxin (ccd killing protein)